MIIVANCPSRIGIFGGGTDLENYSNKYTGLIINLAVNLRQHVKIYTGDDIFMNMNLFPPYADSQFYYHIGKHFGFGGMHHWKIQTDFDGMIKSGLGSSGSAAVCLIGAINKLKGLNLSREQIAKKAYELETSFGVKTGKQDHLAAVYGGLNLFEIGKKIERHAYSRELAEHLASSLVLFYVGGSRNSSILQHKFDKLTKEKIENLNRIKELVQDVALYLDDLELVGKTLGKAWELKKLSNKVSSQKIDKIYKKGKDNGAWGGKICGSGGSGYFVFSINPKKRKQFIEDMDMEEIDWSPDFQGLEARIL
jgi:D-glycero-alpha-D-manno-heptose-7-phosphate kinase